MNYSRGGFLDSIPHVTRNLIIINILSWLATITLPSVIWQQFGFHFNPVNLLGLHYFGANDFNLIQLVSYMFMHDPKNIGHLFFNMFSIYMFGRTLEYVLGPKRFLTYYMITGVGAALIQEAVWYFMLPSAGAIGATTAQMAQLTNGLITIGASGAVFGILLAFGMLFPNTPLYLMFIPIPIKAKYFVIFYGLVELFLGVSNYTGVSNIGSGIAHFAHLGGMLFGFFVIKYWQKKNINNGPFIF